MKHAALRRAALAAAKAQAKILLAGERPVKARSAAQREWSAAVARAAQAWDWLTDDERRSWRTAATSRRMRGFNYFVQTNARRFRNGQELARLPPPHEDPGTNPVGAFLIGWWGGQLVLEFEILAPMTGPISVWASRPCRQGIFTCDKCPRLGLLPGPLARRSDFTELYFAKHGAFIEQQRMLLPGKRIFVRTRVESDAGPSLYKPDSAIVPGRIPLEGHAGEILPM